MPSLLSDDLPQAIESHFRRSSIALALSVVRADVPLVLVNDAFCRLTGYDRADVIGRNCRFMQSSDTPREQREVLHAFVHDPSAEAERFPVVNFRKDGERFLNLVFLTRLRDSTGASRYILASQFDISGTDRARALAHNDVELGRRLGDIETVGREFGLAMLGSTQILADSTALLVKLAIKEG